MQSSLSSKTGQCPKRRGHVTHLIRSSSILRLAAGGAAALVISMAKPVVAQRIAAQAAAPVALIARDQVAAPNGDALPRPARYRPSVGEKATYDVELKGHGVGTASLEVLGREQVDGHSTLHASLRLSAGLLFAKATERLDSWFDPDRYFSRRYAQDNRELGKTRLKNYLISPEKGSFHETHSGTVEAMTTDEPLDDVSMLFHARTLPLRVGDVDTIPRYFKRGHDVVITVLRKETITVPAGRFQTIVLQPTITNAGGLFGQGGKAEVYVSDDPERNVIMIRSSIPVIGSVSLTLRELSGP